MPDPSMDVALQLAEMIGPVRNPPPWLSDIAKVAAIVKDFDDKAMSQKTDADHATPQTLADKINVLSSTYAAEPNAVPGVEDQLERQNILLRTWAGSVGTAKTVKHQTRDPEPLTKEDREAIFNGVINPNCAKCPVYAAGSRAAVALMISRNQKHELCFDGVPEGSLVMQERPEGT